MQDGPRILFGSDCTETKTGQHIVEFNEYGTQARCCQCAIELSDLQRRKAFMALSVDDRAPLLAASARELMRRSNEKE